VRRLQRQVPALHAQLVHQAGKAEAVHQYADAADDAADAPALAVAESF